MDEIVNNVAEKSGVGVDTVRTVLTHAMEFVKEKLPPQFAGQVDMFLKGGGGAGGPGSAAGMGNPLGNLFGGK